MTSDGVQEAMPRGHTNTPATFSHRSTTSPSVNGSGDDQERFTDVFLPEHND